MAKTTTKPAAPERKPAPLRGKYSGGFHVTRIGLQIRPAVTYEDWLRAGLRLVEVHNSSAWCLGDWIVYGQTRYETRYQEAAEAAGLDYQTIRNYAWVARRFEFPRRRPRLSFQHHAEVASMPPPEQDLWLARSESESWSRNELRRRLREMRANRKALLGPAPDEPLPAVGVDAHEVTLGIEVSATQQQCWQAAAERNGHTLDEWIRIRLDDAADLELGSGDTGPDVPPAGHPHGLAGRVPALSGAAGHL
jgi:hypothetical protein